MKKIWVSVDVLKECIYATKAHKKAVAKMTKIQSLTENAEILRDVEAGLDITASKLQGVLDEYSKAERLEREQARKNKEIERMSEELVGRNVGFAFRKFGTSTFVDKVREQGPNRCETAISSRKGCYVVITTRNNGRISHSFLRTGD